MPDINNKPKIVSRFYCPIWLDRVAFRRAAYGGDIRSRQKILHQGYAW